MPAPASRAASRRSRAPNGAPPGRVSTIRAMAPAASKPCACRRALAARAAANADLEGPRALARHGVEDDGDDAGHRASLATEEARPMRRVRAYVGLGANLGDPAATLAAAVHALAALPNTRLRGVSRLYATRPVGIQDQPPFRNAAVALDVPAGPDPATGALALLVALKGLERAFGRRDRERWGPRELDLDLLIFGRSRLSLRSPAGGALAGPRQGGSPARGAPSGCRRAPLRPRAAERPRARSRSARLGRDRCLGSPPPRGDRRPGRGRGRGALER